MNASTERGFTLLEVMVALTIFATLSMALLSALQHITLNSAGLAERTLALWIADNRMNELRAGMRPAELRATEERIEFGGRSWWLFSTIQAASTPNLLQVQLKVSAEESLQDAHYYSRARLTGYIEAQP